MRLGSVSVWFPVLQLRAEVTYRLLPELTPLHRALEAAVNGFSHSGNPLALAPIPELFCNVFGVSGAQEILPDVLDDLIERGRIHRTVDDEGEPSSLRIIDLAPGRREGAVSLVPAWSEADQQAAQTRQLERFFDPVLEEIVNANTLAPEPEEEHQFWVPADPFLTHPPAHWVERELRAELHDDVQLYSVAAELIGHTWRRSSAELHLKSGELAVECDDPRQSEYLRGLSQRVRRAWLLPSSLGASAGRMEHDLEELSIHCQLPSSLGGLALTRGLPDTVRAGLCLPPTVLLVALDAASEITEPTLISSPVQGQAFQVAYPRTDNPGIAGIFLAREGREFLRWPITWEGLQAEIGVFRAASGFQQEGSGWNDVVAALETECRFSDRPEIFILPAFWLDPAKFWNIFSERAGNETDPNTWIKSTVEELKRLPSAVLEPMEESFFRVEAIDNLRNSNIELGNLFQSAQAQFSENVPTNEGVAPVPQSCTRVVAFDTSSLIRYDQLVENLRLTDFLVTPQVVAAEIERRKTESEEFRIVSRRNLRAIDMLPRARWTAPFHDFSLLAPEDKRNTDGAIIAALIPYCQRKLEVVVVSEDHDFLVRCKPYGIEWMNAETFLHTSRTTRKGDR